MDKILWFLGGLVHAVFHSDSSFLTLKMAGHGHFNAVLIIIISNSVWAAILYLINKPGIALFTKRFKRLRDRMQQWSSGVVKRFGYIGMAIICFIPFLPLTRESALVAGQLFQLKYTLLVVIISNATRVILLSLIFF